MLSVLTAPDYVFLGEGYEGFSYGKYCMIIEFEEVSPLYEHPTSPGEYYTSAEIPAERGYWTTIEEVREALKKN